MVWRSMLEADMDAVSAISDVVHGDYTEPRAVYAERRVLFPSGCFVVDAGKGIEGYLIVHPWRRGGPPPLGVPMGPLPEKPDSLYLHDLALLPIRRRAAMGTQATRMVIDIAVGNGLEQVSLLAVNGAETFWTLQGFVPVQDLALQNRLRGIYGKVVYMHRSVGCGLRL